MLRQKRAQAARLSGASEQNSTGYDGDGAEWQSLEQQGRCHCGDCHGIESSESKHGLTLTDRGPRGKGRDTRWTLLTRCLAQRVDGLGFERGEDTAEVRPVGGRGAVRDVEPLLPPRPDYPSSTKCVRVNTASVFASRSEAAGRALTQPRHQRTRRGFLTETFLIYTQ